MVIMERQEGLCGQAILDFGHSILFRVSDFVLRICDIKAGTTYTTIRGAS